MSDLVLRTGNGPGDPLPRSHRQAALEGGAAPGPVIVAGAGRSGTTWVLDALAQANRLRTVFEPLHPCASPVAARYAHRFVPEDASEPELHAYLCALLSGQHRSLWTDFRVRPDRLWPGAPANEATGTPWRAAAQRWKRLGVHYLRYRRSRGFRPPIVKFIRANLLLGWLRTQFDLPTVLLLRHPGAVVESRLRLGGEDWTSPQLLRRFRADRALWDAHLGEAGSIFERELSPAEAHAAAWCVENQIPLRTAARLGIHVVFFENLVLDPVPEWTRLVDRLGLGVVPRARALERPSQQARRSRAGAPRAELALGWRSRIEDTVLEELQRVLDHFQVRAYRADDPMPRSEAAGATS